MTGAVPTLEYARAVADAVLYEGYLLYPYRATSSKNMSRWQFGVLGPPGAAEAGYGEDPAVASQFLLRRLDHAREPVLTVRLRLLQLQQRSAQQLDQAGQYDEVAELVVGGQRWLTWDEAVEREVTLGPWPLAELEAGRTEPVLVSGGTDVEPVSDGFAAGRLVRNRRDLQAQLQLRAERVDEPTGLVRVSVRVENVAVGAATDKAAAIGASFIGAHLLLEVDDGEFTSMTDPPAGVEAAAAACAQHRCWPVLAGPDGDNSVLLVSPIILPDHPELAPQSAGALFDSTEIDEILSLRVMTMTDEEKAVARATDPRAAEIIDRCDALSPEAMQQMHGVLRDSHALAGAVGESWDDMLNEPFDGVRGPPGLADIDLTNTFGFDGEVPWWDPAVDSSVSPGTDEVVIDGVTVANGSTVRVHPSRGADAQDLFFEDQIARVFAVHSDVDGQTHVAVLLVDDPAAELHDLAGRYFYFAPDELEPISGPPLSSADADNGKESRT